LYIPVVGGITAAALGIAAFFGYKKKKKATRYTNGHTPPAQYPAKGRRPVRVNGRA
jgi:LPXTG-motif cell wall-anchored protein